MEKNEENGSDGDVETLSAVPVGGIADGVEQNVVLGNDDTNNATTSGNDHIEHINQQDVVQVVASQHELEQLSNHDDDAAAMDVVNTHGNSVHETNDEGVGLLSPPSPKDNETLASSAAYSDIRSHEKEHHHGDYAETRESVSSFKSFDTTTPAVVSESARLRKLNAPRLIEFDDNGWMSDEEEESIQQQNTTNAAPVYTATSFADSSEYSADDHQKTTQEDDFNSPLVRHDDSAASSPARHDSAASSPAKHNGSAASSLASSTSSPSNAQTPRDVLEMSHHRDTQSPTRSEEDQEDDERQMEHNATSSSIEDETDAVI
jgi:hypothetical protein